MIFLRGKKLGIRIGLDLSNAIDFEGFLRAYLNLNSQAAARLGNSNNSSSFLQATTTTLLHTIDESERESYVAHINSYLRDDPFMKQFLPIDPATNALFELARAGFLLCKLINVAVPNTIDERAINTKRVLNPWERNENHTLCLNSAKAIGCTVVNIGNQDLVEGKPHLVLGLISQIIKIQLLADLNLRKMPQLVELVEDNNDVEELMGLAPEKVLLKWMNFHLKKAGYKKPVTNFSSDLKIQTSNVIQIDNLIKFCPTKDEMEQIKQYNGDKDDLAKCERFFFELMRVPRSEAKLGVFSFKLQFCTYIRSSVKPRRVMQTVLSLGNALNQGTPRGAALGFRLDSLLKLNDTRGWNNNMTLMHYLCKVIAVKQPELLDLSNELSSLKLASKIRLKFVADDMQEITRELERVILEKKSCKKNGQVSNRFRKCLKKFLASAEIEVKNIAAKYLEVV